MISMLKGEVVQNSGSDITLMVCGVGYLVHVPAGTSLSLVCGDEATLFTTLIAREDSMDLYGFTDLRQKEIFSLLLNVSGVGPKTAMNVISGIDPNQFLDEVVNENISYLSTLPGIGKKSAQRIVLELKEKIAKLYKVRARTGGPVNISEDAVAALVALGYSETQARRSVGCVRADSVEDLVRGALKELM
ncbi:MAG TPA: Holliday junction branch migration protein RuvA [Deltaproteobacteria bacterium]|nr:Holliday junction branch migration protein RuvA [Deltaproteobacteria bacterium]